MDTFKRTLSCKKPYMDIRNSRFDFLRIEHLTWVGDFSHSADFGASVDHYNVLRSCLLHLNVLREFNILSKSGLGIKIGQSCAEIFPIFHKKTSEITTFQKYRKIESFDIFIFFSWFLLILTKYVLIWCF